MEPQAQAPAQVQTPAQAPALAQPSPAQAKPDSQAKAILRGFVIAAMKIVYDKETSQQLIAMMKAGADNPPQAVAKAAQMVLGLMQGEVKGINPELVYTSAMQVVLFLFELASISKTFEGDMKMVQQAIQILSQQKQSEPAQPTEQPVAQPAQQPAQGLIGGALSQGA